MGVNSFSNSVTDCVLTMSETATGYSPGQKYTVTLTSSSPYAYKIETVGGATVTGAGGDSVRTDCVNYNSKRTSATLTWTAPASGAGGAIKLRAICGNYNTMTVATELSLQPGLGVTVASTDPAYQFERGVDAKLKFFFSTNDTHGDFKIAYTGTGFVGIGFGSKMLQSNALIGLDPVSNPGLGAVGLYKLVTKTGNTQQLLANSTVLPKFGIVGSSYAVVGGVSTLKFTLVKANQKPEFTILPAGSNADIIYAAGSAQLSLHSVFGVWPSSDFSGANGPPAAPGTVVKSTDPNFDFEVLLKTGLKLFFKKNATHGAFRMARNTPGYVALGIGKAMIGSSALVGMDPTKNAGFNAVGVYKLSTKVGSNAQVLGFTPETALALGDFGVFDSTFKTTASGSEMRWTIDLAKQNPQLTLFSGAAFAGAVDIIYASGSEEFSFHGTFGSYAQVNFASGIGGGAGIDLGTNMAAHIAFMILAWELSAPIGIILPLFNNVKHGLPGVCKLSAPSWFKYHWVVLTVGVFFGFIGTLTGYLYVEEKQSAHFSDTHKNLGLVILLGSIAQPLWGRFRPAKVKTGEEKTRARKNFEAGHPAFGYLLLAIAMINCLIGVNELARVTGGQDYMLAGVQGKVGFEGSLGVFIVILFSAFTLVILYGFIRDWNNRKNAAEPTANAVTISMKQVDDNFSSFNPSFGQPGGSGVSWSTVISHNTENSCWVVYNGKAYDVTKFLQSHPGGKRVIVQYAGKDITTAFNDVGHSASAVSTMNRYLVGSLGADVERGRDAMPSAMPSPIPPKLAPRPEAVANPNAFLVGGNQNRKTVRVMEKIAISHNVFMIKFALPKPSMVLGLPSGKHICLYAPNPTPTTRGKWNGQTDNETGKSEISRKYTPISCDAKDVGYFTIVTKCYRPEPQKGFPDGGKMSRYLDSLREGDSVDIAGPFGGHEYLGGGRFVDNGHELQVRQVAMIAGGSGITPMFQLLRAMLQDPNDPCRISVVYANSSIDDVLLKSSLDDLARKYPKRLQVWYTISKEPPAGREWNYSIGRVTQHMLEKRFPPPSPESLVISCGPQPMMEHVASLLRKIGYPDERRIDY